MVVVDIPAEYGYCVLVAVGSQFVLMWKAVQVGKMRKKFKIYYPVMYSPDNALFNCYQRAHQNTLEVYPQFLTCLAFGGLYNPTMSAAAGAVWVAGRVAYALGYYTGDPKKRMWGAFSYAGYLPLIYFSVRQGAKMLGWF
ncbi:microsomal glutathione S-transferase 3 [Hyalella azteca]|uniref:Glutathione S-transferase 3, mitochondrial n=1 Tax=Hyalella azteca TaxID=294128 RepID=A0A8B7P7Z2_HYAAZ|nr:microsomal glutathione S-transferase 3 [Hyalella azteca]